MAYWRKRLDKYVTVYVEDKPLPRKLTKHLDNCSEVEINQWVEKWQALNAAYTHRIDTTPISPELNTYLTRYLEYQKTVMQREPGTLRTHKRHLLSAIQFFDNAPLTSWPTSSKQFVQHIVETKKVSTMEAYRHGQTLKLFWDWCRDEDLVDVDLRMKGRRFRQGSKATPLETLITPEDVLAWQLPPDLKLLSLLCYFFSLRPQEAFVATRFLAGSEAAKLECCRLMAETKVKKSGHQLYNRLAVYIEFQKTGKGDVRPPKTPFSVGWVACFDERAARQVVALVKQNLAYPRAPSTYYNRWGREKLGATLKDLRRASIYWLGHNTDMQVISLKNHARHSTIMTTELYLRRPWEKGQEDDLDLDA